MKNALINLLYIYIYIHQEDEKIINEIYNVLQNILNIKLEKGFNDNYTIINGVIELINEYKTNHVVIVYTHREILQTLLYII